MKRTYTGVIREMSHGDADYIIFLSDEPLAREINDDMNSYGKYLDGLGTIGNNDWRKNI